MDLTESQKRLLSLWGKSDEKDETQTNYHPLLFHLLDVGNVTRLLWEVLPAPAKARFARALGLPDDQTERVIVLLAAQHDLGKASSFQRKVTSLNDGVIKQGLDFSTVQDAPHGYVTTNVLPALVANGNGGWYAALPDANLLARIIGGHHGTFPDALDTVDMGQTVTGDAAWDEVRKDLLQEVARLFYQGLPPVQLPEENRLRDPALVPLLGGLVSVADWIGSSQDHFSPAAKHNWSPDEYMVKSAERAETALKTFGWTPATKFAESDTFDKVFPFAPNDLQKATVALVDNAKSPYLLIVEAAMGEGKTESALYAIDHALTTQQSHGFYFALPTQATGNALFERILKNYIGRHKIHGDVNVQLVHSGSFLSTAFDKLRMEAIYGSGNTANDGTEGRVLAETWFTYRKRPLLAPFGIGTIDQSLTGVLQTRHWFVRLFGLAGKVVVLDEVHAYDVYMSELIKRLVGWLRALGCTVVLLSATLSQKQRRDLLQAWDADVTEAPVADYPRLTLSADGVPTAQTVLYETTPPPKNVEVAYVPVDFAPLADQLAEDLPNGGCAVVICNTVSRAQEAYRIFCDRLEKDGWEVHLFHARTIAQWRGEREKEVLHWFGKEGERPAKAVLIATQVVEQSLDLDFDWMASEMAPVDLLLQRMGRLWRHKRDKRPTQVARFQVLCGETETGLPVFPPHSELIYAPYILLRSRLALTPGTLTLPTQIAPLIRAVYDADLTESNMPSGEWWEKLEAAKEKQEHEREEDTEIALTNMIPSPERGAVGVLRMGRNDKKRDLRDDENPQTHPTMKATTRLGEQSLSVVCVGTDSDGNDLASPVLTAPASVKEVRSILGFALSLSQRGLFRELVKNDPPSVWKESPHLRYHRVLEFNRGVSTCAGYTLRLSQNEGLEIKKEEKATEE